MATKMLNGIRRRSSQLFGDKRHEDREDLADLPSYSPTRAFFAFRKRSKGSELDVLPACSPTISPAQPALPRLSVCIFPDPTLPSDFTMTSTPPYSQPVPPLSLLVILPSSSAHTSQNALPSIPANRPAPLVSRQSGSAVSTLQSLQVSSAKLEKAAETGEESDEVDRFMAAGRRMSLAPGLGAGITGSVTPFLGAVDTSLPDTTENARSMNMTPPSISAPRFGESSRAPGFGAPAFGSGPKRSSTGRSTRGRPMTAAGGGKAIPLAPTPGGVNRQSVALASGMSLGMSVGVAGGMSRNRPGWEGDEIVGVMRGSGLEGELRVARRGPVCLEEVLQAHAPGSDTPHRLRRPPLPSIPVTLYSLCSVSHL